MQLTLVKYCANVLIPSPKACI